ncbi:MAG: tetratricopeptide repeat protein [Nitrospirota bacterium]
MLLFGMVIKDKYLPVAVSLFLALATVIVYAQVGGHEFLFYDDNMYVTENPRVQEGLSWNSVVWAFTAMHAANWHPLTWLSHILDVQIFGLNPGPHHIVNVLFHASSTVLLFLALLRMTGVIWRSAFVAALFALHPLHVESVAWVAERKDLLSAFFGLLTVLAYIHYSGRPNILRYTLTALMLALGLLSKPMLVTLPFLFLLLDYWPLGRISGRLQSANSGGPVCPQTTLSRLILEKVPLLALCAVTSMLTVIAQKGGGAVADLSLGMGARIANALAGYVQYLWKTFWPVSLSVFYPHPGDTLPVWQAAGAGLFLIALTVFVLLRLRQSPWLAVGWFWYLGMLVPVIGLVQVGAQSIADRYTYLPLIGIFIMLAWELPERLRDRRFGKQALGAVSAAVIIILAVLTWIQTGYWKTHETLFRHAISVTSDNCLAQNSLADYLIRKDDLDGAYPHLRETLRLCPKNESGWYNLGVWQRKNGELQEAVSSFNEALRLKPDYANAWSNLGAVYMTMGRIPEATDALLEATRLTPDDPAAWFNFGSLYAKTGQIQSAVGAYLRAVRLKPDFGAAWTGLGIAYQSSGMTEEAVTAFERAAQSQSGDYAAWYNLGVIYGKTGQLERAVEALGNAVRIKPDHAASLHRLGMTYITLGRQGEAMEIINRLRMIDPARAEELMQRMIPNR